VISSIPYIMDDKHSHASVALAKVDSHGRRKTPKSRLVSVVPASLLDHYYQTQ
jgi:hypothetical protein